MKTSTSSEVEQQQQHNSKSTRRAKKACTECRQQKAKCNVTNGIPCSRCRKVNAICIVSDPFKRENKRQKLDDLKNETEKLREQLKSIDENHERGLRTRKAYSGSSGETSPASGSPSAENSGQPGPDNAMATSVGRPTQSRSIDGFKLSADEIDELFELYFLEFSQHLPILDHLQSPNMYYDSSEFLFWAIIGVSCRAYTKSKTYLLDLRSRVCDLAFDTLKAAPTLQGIQGVLLVVNWPFPKKNGIWNPTFALLGAVLHCAMNIGLHIPSSYQEFYKHRSRLTEEDIAQRTKVWAYCVMVYQRTSICKGSSVFTLNDFCQDPKARSVLYERLDSNTSFRLRLRDSVSQALRAFAECGLQEMTSEQDQVLKLLIQTHQTKLENLCTQSGSMVDDLDSASATLTLQTFHLFRTDIVEDTEPIIKLFSSACQSLERLDKLLQLGPVGLKALPFFHQYSLLNASQILLRLYKTPVFSICIDETRAKAMVLLAINLAKKISVQKDDLAGRAVHALDDIVDSKKAFRNLNGDGLPTPLRVRSRGVMSILLDGLVWWREEFGGTMGVYPVPLRQLANDQSSNDLSSSREYGAETRSNFQEPFDMALDSFFNEPGWMGFEDLLSPAYFDLNSSLPL